MTDEFHTDWKTHLGYRASWVKEWVVFRRKMEGRTWPEIAAEIGCGPTTAADIYREALGDQAYTGPLPEWVDDDALCVVCRGDRDQGS